METINLMPDADSTKQHSGANGINEFPIRNIYDEQRIIDTQLGDAADINIQI